MNINLSQAELKKMDAEFRKQVTHSGLTTAPLDSDWLNTLKHWQKDKRSPYWSRMAIRCLCASIEARLFVFKKMTEHMAPLNGVELNQSELEILAEGKSIESNGVKVIKPKFLSFPESVKETFRLFAKAANITNPVEFGDVGYMKLCQVFEVRNRLMHPKKPFDVEVRESDIRDADEAIVWFNNAHNALVEQSLARSKEKSESILKKARK